MKKILLCGAPSSGKSTCAVGLYFAMKKMGKNVELVQEFARRDLQREEGFSHIYHQYRLMHYANRDESNYPPETEYLICDGGVITHYFYSAFNASNDDPRERLVILDSYQEFLDALYKKRYDYIYYVPLMNPPKVDDGTRYQSNDQVLILDDFMKLFLFHVHPMPYTKLVDTPLEARIDWIIKDLFGQDIKV